MLVKARLAGEDQWTTFSQDIWPRTLTMAELDQMRSRRILLVRDSGEEYAKMELWPWFILLGWRG